MGMNKSILKRIQAVESELGFDLSFSAPSLIWVGYDPEKGVYTVKEEYMNEKCKVVKVQNFEFAKLPEYVFHPEFSGTCFFELFDAPIPEPNLYIIQGKELQKETGRCHGMVIDFEVEQNKDNNQRTVNVDVHGVWFDQRKV